MNNNENVEQKVDGFFAPSVRNPTTVVSARRTKEVQKLTALLGQEFLSTCQSVVSIIDANELEVSYRGQDIIEKVCWLVNAVEAKLSKLRTEGISQKQISKKTLIEIITQRSQSYYDKNYSLISQYREYLEEETTESPTSIRHAVRIIKNNVSSERRGESMAQSTAAKTAMLDLVGLQKEKIQALEQELLESERQRIEAEQKIAQLQEALNTANENIKKHLF